LKPEVPLRKAAEHLSQIHKGGCRG
jgi:hypothetical protein